MKDKVAILFIFFFMVACTASRKASDTSAQPNSADTAKVVDAKNEPVQDSAKVFREVYNKMVSNKINFTSFSSKIKVAYSTSEESDDVTAYVHMLKDSVVWISLRGLLGIEGARVLITKDSIKVINYLQKTVQYKDISYLGTLTGLPFDFSTIQDLLIGNPVMMDTSISSLQTNGAGHLIVLMAGFIFNHKATVDTVNYKIIESELIENTAYLPRVCRIEYSNYNDEVGFPFSQGRKIFVGGQSNLQVNMEYKSYLFNEPVNFPFSIQSNFKKL